MDFCENKTVFIAWKSKWLPKGFIEDLGANNYIATKETERMKRKNKAGLLFHNDVSTLITCLSHIYIISNYEHESIYIQSAITSYKLKISL